VTTRIFATQPNAMRIAALPAAEEQRLFGLALSPSSLIVPDWRYPSAWMEHAPFAGWLIEAARPGSFVELGSHYGYSFLAVCQTVRALGLATQCVAIDTWRGDRHAGFYGDNVFETVKAQSAKYAPWATMKRMTFDDAVKDFADRSIDILHIDGRHFYEDVKHDYESWRPKLSDRAVVLFHDTQVRDRNFGVYRLWDEIRG